jgi:hypothetical protein
MPDAGVEDLAERINATVASLQELLAEFREQVSAVVREVAAPKIAQLDVLPNSSGESLARRWYKLICTEAPRFPRGTAAKRTPSAETVLRVARVLFEGMNATGYCIGLTERELVKLAAADGAPPPSRDAVGGCIRYLVTYKWIEERAGSFRGQSNRRRGFQAKIPAHLDPDGPDRPDGGGTHEEHAAEVLVEVAGRADQQTTLIPELANAPPPGAEPREVPVLPFTGASEPPVDPFPGEAGGSSSSEAGTIIRPALAEAGLTARPASLELAWRPDQDSAEPGTVVRPASPKAGLTDTPAPPATAEAGLTHRPASGAASIAGRPASPVVKPASPVPPPHTESAGSGATLDARAPTSIQLPPKLDRPSGQAEGTRNDLQEEEETTLSLLTGDTPTFAQIDAALRRRAYAWAEDVAAARHPGSDARARQRQARAFDEFKTDALEALAHRDLWVISDTREEVPLNRWLDLFETGLTQRRAGRSGSVLKGVEFAVRGYAIQLREDRRIAAELRAAAAARVPEGRSPEPAAIALGDDVWGRACNRLMEKIGERAWRSWLGPTSLLELTTEMITVSTPNPFAGDWIADKYRGDLERLVAEEVGHTVALTVVFRASGAGDGGA